jgi:internalin A
MKIKTQIKTKQILKRILSMTTAIVMVITAIPVTVTATTQQSTAKELSNFIAPIELIADKSDWIAISDRAGLEAISRHNRNGKFYLTNDIDLSGKDWEPYDSGGIEDYPFTGIFDGQGYVIRNMTTTKTDANGDSFYGLFMETNGATIKNVGFESVNFNINVNNGMEYVGGIVGSATGTTIDNCYVTGDISAPLSLVGGIAGTARDTDITNSYNTADISGGTVGGIVGFVAYGSGGQDGPGSTIQNCFNTGDITANGDAGGIVAEGRTPISITNSFNSGNITSNKNYGIAAGIIGDYSSGIVSVISVYNTGNITAVYHALGITFGGYSPYSNVYNSGELSAETVYDNLHIDDIDLDEFDFDNTWTFIDDVNNGLPVLRVFEHMYTPDPPTSLPQFIAPIEPIADKTGWTAISNRAELEAIKDNLSGKYYLTNDIDLAGKEWVPIGDNDWYNLYFGDGSERFTGILDGQGYVIRNMTITKSHSFVGLFTCIGYIHDNKPAEIRNLGMEDTNIDITNSTHATVGSLFGGSFHKAVVSNCYNTGNISISTGNAGGISGSNDWVVITDSYNTGDITIKNDSVINDLYAQEYAGGIVANTGWNSHISNCFNTGNITVKGEDYAISGGIAGGVENSSSVRRSFNTGNVTATTSTEFSDSAASAGGINGLSNHDDTRIRIFDCYNTGTTSAFGNGSTITGGITGSDVEVTEIKTSYTTTDTGGYIFDNDYFTTPLTAEQMKKQSSFTGFDFENTWTFIDGVNNGMPVLRVFERMYTPVQSQLYPTPAGYSDNDYQKLVAFMLQGNNLSELPLWWDLSDPETWSGVQWNDTLPKRVIGIHLQSDNGRTLEGKFDLTGFNELRWLEAANSGWEGVLDLSDSPLLEVISIYWNSFTHIEVHPDVKNYTTIDGVLFNKNVTTLIKYPRLKTNTTYTIPSTVTEIRWDAFKGCEYLTKIALPDSVTSIGDSAFALNPVLTEITIPSGVTEIDNFMFFGCTGLKSITFKSDTPPTFGYLVFYSHMDILTPVPLTGITVYVPLGAKSAYQKVVELSEFDIIEIGENGTDPPTDIPTIDPPIPHKFTIEDALNILKQLAKIEQLTPEQAKLYDFFDNGTINISSVLELLKHLAKIRPNAIDDRPDIPIDPPTLDDPPTPPDPPVDAVRLSECDAPWCRTCNLELEEGFIVACYRGWSVNTPQINNEKLAEMVADGTIPKNITHLKISDFGWINLSDISPLAELTELVWLDLESNRITDISPLAGLTKLERLDLDFNFPVWVDSKGMDISPLANLTNMIELDIRWNGITDLTPIASMTRLEELDIRNNSFTDLTPLVGLNHLWNLEIGRNGSLENVNLEVLTELPSLTHLNLERSHNIDLTRLEGLTNLTHLNLHRSSITDITPLSKLTNLTYLDLSRNEINDIAPLTGLTNLTHLDLSRNGINDLAPLAGLTNLTKLILWSNQINDPTPLINLTNLTELDLRINSLNAEKLKETIEAMPWCEILHLINL